MLAELVKTKEIFLKKKADLKSEYENNLKEIEWEINENERQQKLFTNGLDLSKITLAEHVLYVSHKDGLRGDDINAINGAISDLARGATTLRNHYYATKNYDRWSHQECGPCEYGMGPRHGSVVFEIGLSPPKRKETLTTDETDAAIYLLMMLKEGKYFSNK